MDPTLQIGSSTAWCRLKVHGVDSNIESIEVRVPQRSCLGPLLFIAYINDLPRAVKNFTTSMYADDMSMCFNSRDLFRLNEALNEDFSHLDTWFISNELSLNVAKTQPMLVSTRSRRNALDRSNQNLQVKIQRTELEVVNKNKYL